MQDLRSLQQTQKMQQPLMSAQTELAGFEVTGQAGRNLATVTLTGSGEVRSVTIDPKVVDPDNLETLQDFVMGAMLDAHRALQGLTQQKMGPSTSALGGPSGGFNLPRYVTRVKPQAGSKLLASSRTACRTASWEACMGPATDREVMSPVLVRKLPVSHAGIAAARVFLSACWRAGLAGWAGAVCLCRQLVRVGSTNAGRAVPLFRWRCVGGAGWVWCQ
jgi:nucleoid-associated protein EbfC